ncbi:MAG: hypothetical protein RL007_1905 [Bacteroidota bacterium]|jgi:hypothetical protein
MIADNRTLLYLVTQTSHFMKRILTVAAIILALTATAQSRLGNRPGGQFSLGVRTTTSLFSNESGIGTGFGGQFRLRFFELLNSEWFADYITSDVGNGIGNRTDYHIGWSVMFYPGFAYYQGQKGKLQPYFLAGHCFDYTYVEGNDFRENNSMSRWSSAIQGGLGVHYPFHDRIDVSLSAQYMYHLGTEIHPNVRYNAAGTPFLAFEEEEKTGLEGHVLISCSMNVRIADLWKNKIKGVQDKKPVEEVQ